MSLSAFTFWIDYEKRRLLESFTSSAQAPTPVFTQGDTVPVEIHLFRQNGAIREEIAFPAGSTLKMGIGRIETLPTAGSFILGYKTASTSELSWNASASDIQTALNALAPVASEGGVSVSQAGDAFLIVWNAGVSHDPFSGDPDELFPPSNISLASQVLGDSQRTLLHLQQSPIAYLDDFATMDDPQASLTLISTSGQKKIYRLEISPSPAGGTFIISSTVGATTQDSNAISVEALASSLLSLLPSNAATGASVIKSGSYSWDISVAIEVSLAVDDAGLKPWLGKQGRITLATAEVHQFLSGAPSGNATLEILLAEEEGETTLIQTLCRIQADMIDEGLINPLPLSPPLSEAVANTRYLRRDLDQNPDASTQDQIWENLGVSQDGSDVVAAINASSSPSAGNAFVTASAVNGLITGFAPINSPTFTGTVTIPSGASISGYLTTASASSTYQPISGMSSYLTTASASSTYQTISGMSSYLTTASASSTYQTISGMASYLPKASPDFTGTMISQDSALGLDQDLFLSSIALNLTSLDAGNGGYQSLTASNGSNPGSDLADLSWGSYLELFRSTNSGAQVESMKIRPGSLLFNQGQASQITLSFGSLGIISSSKISGTSISGKAGMNIGIGGTSVDATTPGDLWISTGGSSLNFRDATGAWRQLLSTSSAGQIVSTSTSPLLRLEQRGTGRSFVVEDQTTPDTDCFIIDNSGNVGVGVSNGTPAWVASHKMEVNGAIKANTITFDGSAQFKVNSTAAHSSGANTHDLFISYAGSTYRIPMIFVSTP